MLSDTTAAATVDRSATDGHPDTAAIIAAATAFLEHYGTPYLLGSAFAAHLGSGDGRAKFRHLLEATGFAGDPEGFCRRLVDHLLSPVQRSTPLVLNGVTLPQLLQVAVLEQLLPGRKFISVRNVDQLEQLTDIPVPADRRADMQQVIDTYPVRLSMHTLRQMRVSRDVAYQYLPFVEELDPIGHTNTWIGQFHSGLLEQMYRNRVIFLLNMTCPVYCRFCFRKHKESRNMANPTPADVAQAVEHVRSSPTVKEIVITGGDPFLNRANLAAAIDGLKEVDHVQTLRLATRSIAYYPNLFLADDGQLLTYLKMKNLELQLKGKRLEVATHFIHPDEVSPDGLEIISDLVKNGIAVYIQTPFLYDCNDKGPELVRLFGLLRGAGAELHYIYIPCSPIHGNSIYWTPISKGIEVAAYLRAHVSDRVVPRICTATPIGKMDWFSSGWAVRPDPDDEHFIWIRTPYTPDYFKSFAPLADTIDNIRVNAEGTLDVRYMAKIGDPGLFLGARKRPSGATAADAHGPSLAELQTQVRSAPLDRTSIVATPSPRVARLHLTRALLTADAQPADLDYIRRDARISDVVLAAAGDVPSALGAIADIVAALQGSGHVNAVRLRSLAFNYAPESYTREAVRALGALNRLTVADPLRLEIETQFLHPAELGPAHRRLTRALNNQGITVYANTPLISGVNTRDETINRLAYGLREAGIEFHHLYVAGLDLQERLNAAQPVDIADVFDIGTRVRRDGSGREIPRYIIRTPLGEVDFGLTSRLKVAGDAVEVALSPYKIDYFRGMDPAFGWPQGVREDTDGAPLVKLRGLRDGGGFLV